MSDYILHIVAHIDFIVLLVGGNVSSDLIFVFATLSFPDAPQDSLEVRKTGHLTEYTLQTRIHFPTSSVEGHGSRRVLSQA